MGAWADGLLVSTTESASAEYQYKIFCRNASTYFLGNTTNATNSGADYGLFAFFADTSGDYTNGYYIYSIFEGKWVTYSAGESYSGGKDKISLVADKPSVPWNIAADDSDSKYYDIRPFKTSDKSVADLSWNWYNGASNNTSNTMGFYSYTNDNSGWGIVLAGGSGSPVADRKVVALYNVPSDDNQYPLYNSSGSAKVYSATSGQTPQYFILRQNGLDNSGEALYRLQKAEADGNYLNYQSFGTSETNYLFLNTSSSFYSYYTYSGTPAESPYFDFIRKWPNATDNSSRPYSAQVAQCNDGAVNMYSGNYNTLPAPKDAKGSWNCRWAVNELTGYNAWQVVMSGTTSGTVTYSGSALISGGTATQSYNGMFVLSATPSASDFTVSVVDGCLTDPSITIDSNRKIIKVVYTSYTSIYNTIKNALSTTPEGVGYPTAATRAALQDAIDAFDASSKITSDLVTLNTAYNTFLTTVVLPELGKIYTIQSYIKSPSTTTYLKNEGGTLTIGTDASETALNNLWVVRKSGDNFVLQSAADPTKYIVYTSFTLAASGSTWTFSNGTELPYISMYNSTLDRYVACNGNNQFGTAGGSGYYASAKTQYSGWSTDFKFVESPDYACYKVKILYPNGSAPTVTYSGNAYSNGSDFVAPTTLTAGELTVSEVAGYTPTVTIDDDVIYVNYAMEVGQTYADTWNFDASPWSLLTEAPKDIIVDTYRYNTKRIAIVNSYNTNVGVKFSYTSGNSRIDVAGVDLLDPSTGDVVKGDYHDGYSGNQQDKREYVIRNVAPGNYVLRYISWGASTSSAGNITVEITPADGYYRIRNNGTGNYLAYGTPIVSGGTRPAGLIATSNNTDAASIIKLTGSYGTCKLTVQGLNIQSQTANNVAFPGTDAEGVDFVFNVSTPGVVSITNAASAADSNHDGSLHEATDGWTVHGVVNWSASAANSKWVIEEATTFTVPLNGPVDGSYYATLCVPFDVTLDGATAYTLNLNAAGTALTMTEVEGTVAAGTPALLKGASASATATISNPSSTAISTETALTGTYLAKAVTGSTDYFLGMANGKVGFYHWDGSTLSANRAYLEASKLNNSGVKGFALDFEDDATSIQTIDNGQQTTEGAIYNVAGQRMNKMQKGINIINGKKILK